MADLTPEQARERLMGDLGNNPPAAFVQVHADALRVFLVGQQLAALRAEHIPREDRQEALNLAASAAESGAELAAVIRENNNEPWRWAYPRYLADVAAYQWARSAVHDAIAARRLLKLED